MLKGEVLSSRLTNNLIMESERTYNGGVGVGALQRCKTRVHGADSSHEVGCNKNIACEEELKRLRESNIRRSGMSTSSLWNIGLEKRT